MANQSFIIPSSSITRRSDGSISVSFSQRSNLTAFSSLLRRDRNDRYFQGISFGSETIQFYVNRRSSGFSPSRLSDKFEDNGYLVLRQGERRIPVYIGNLDKFGEVGYYYDISQFGLNLKPLIDGLDPSQDATLEVWDEEPTGLAQELALNPRSATLSNKTNNNLIPAEPAPQITDFAGSASVSTSGVRNNLLKGVTARIEAKPEIARVRLKRFFFEDLSGSASGAWFSRSGITEGGTLGFQGINLQGGENPSIRLSFSSRFSGDLTDAFRTYGHLILIQNGLAARIPIGGLDTEYRNEYQLTGFGAEQLNDFIDAFNYLENITIVFNVAEPPDPVYPTSSQVITIPASTERGGGNNEWSLTGSNAVLINSALRAAPRTRRLYLLDVRFYFDYIYLDTLDRQNYGRSTNRRDLSIRYENEGYLVFRQGGNRVQVSIGGIDSSSSYQYDYSNFTSEEQQRLTDFHSKINTAEDIILEIWDGEPTQPAKIVSPQIGKGVIAGTEAGQDIVLPVNKIETEAAETQIISQSGVSKVDSIPFKIKPVFGSATATTETKIDFDFIPVLETFTLSVNLGKATIGGAVEVGLYKGYKIASPDLVLGKGSIRGGQSTELLDDNQRIEDISGPAYMSARSTSTIKINKPNINIDIGWSATSDLVFDLEAITLPDTYEIGAGIKNTIESGLEVSFEHIRVIETFEIDKGVFTATASTSHKYGFEQKLTTRLPRPFNPASASSTLKIEIETGLFRGERVEPSVSANTIKSAQDFDLLRILPPPPSNRFILRPIDLTIAGANVIALWQPESGSLLPVPQDLWASNQQLFLGFVRIGTSGVVQLRFRASQVAPSSGANDDISDDFENNGVIVFETAEHSVRLDIGGLDTTEPYGYRIVGRQLRNLQAFLRSLPSNTNSIVMTLFSRNPPNLISTPASRTRITSTNPISVDHIGLYQIKGVFGPATMSNTVNILREQVDPTRGNTIGPITPQPIVGWAATIEGIGLSRAYFRVWSGLGQLDLDGEVFEGTTFEGGSFASVSPVEHSVGSPSSRVNVSIAVPSAAVRDMLNYDVGPVWIRVFNIISQDNGLSWTKLPTGIAGRLSRPSFDVEGSVYTMEIETYSGDADRGRPKIWSAESQPGDKGFDFARSYESGVEIRWPP